jgi:DNA mismatch repair protein MutL
VVETRDRVYQVFGAQLLEDLVDLGYTERTLTLAASGEDEEETDRVFALRGFVSRPQVQKLNRNSIYLFVNGRLIRDKLLMHALHSAYHNLMPPACYPFALLFLDCDCEEVDVNVHPSKTEVRFRHGTFVHDFVRDTIRSVLMQSRPVSSAPLAVSPQPAAQLPYSEFTQALENTRFEAAEVQPSFTGAPEDLPIMRLHSPPPPAPRFEFHEEAPTPAPVKLRIPDTHGGFPGVEEYDSPASMDELKDLRPVGQLHNSFIIAAGRDGLWIIDQHVAHERILFEQVLRSRDRGGAERQHLLMPVVLELTAAQQLQYARIADEMNASGFDTEPFGNRTIAVKAAPAGVGQGDIERLVFEILEIAEGEMRSLSLDDIRRGVAASIACRAAIKVNMRLDQTKMEWLLNALSATDYPMSCPHGRPVALRYSMRDILKGFHRI